MKKIFLLIILLIIPKAYALEDKVNYLESLSIENYELNFDKNKYEYDINIGDESNLNIDYKLSDDSIYVNIIGNGNFNQNDNIIKINVNNDYEYTIHAHKSINVSYIEDKTEIKEISNTKKEIIIILIITISSTIIFGFYYVIFVNKSTLKI